MSDDERRTYVTTHPGFKLDGTPITTAVFDADEDSGAVLSAPNTGIVAADAIDFPKHTDDTYLNRGDLIWSVWLPFGAVGTGSCWD